MKSAVFSVATASVRKMHEILEVHIVSTFKIEELAKKEAAIRIASCWFLSWLTLRP
jgi:hypothetical protein